MYIFIHHKVPEEVIRLSEMISLAQFGTPSSRVNFWANDAGELDCVYPEEAEGDPQKYGERIHFGFQVAQGALSDGHLSAIAQSPVNGRWVKIPSEYWIQHRAYEQQVNLENGHELNGAPMVVDLATLPRWQNIIRQAEAVSAPPVSGYRPKRVRESDPKKRRLGIFFKTKIMNAPGERTQKRWHQIYKDWNRRESPSLEPYSESGFKKWLRAWFDESRRW